MSTNTPQWMQRRLAARAKRITQRRAAESPAIAAYLQTIVPMAESYMNAYDRCHKYEANWKKELAEGKGAIAVLLKQIQSWLPLIKRDVLGFNAAEYGDRPQVPDDVIEDGERLASLVEEWRDAKGNPLAYQKEAVAALGAALQAAAKEWGEAEAADKEYQSLAAQVRDFSAAFQKELVPLRRTLMALVGRGDKDFQKLRADRAGQPDEDDDPNVPVPPKAAQTVRLATP